MDIYWNISLKKHSMPQLEAERTENLNQATNGDKKAGK